MKINGTENFKGSEIKDRIEGLSMTPKSTNEAGLQIADLLANPIGRFILDIKKTEPGHEIDYSILEKKLRSNGLIILPK